MKIIKYFTLVFMMLAVILSNKYVYSQDIDIAAQESAEFKKIIDSIDVAMISQDIDLVTSVVINAVKDHPSLSGRTVRYATSNFPQTSVAIVSNIGVVGADPKAVEVAISTIVQTLGDSPANKETLREVTKTIDVLYAAKNTGTDNNTLSQSASTTPDNSTTSSYSSYDDDFSAQVVIVEVPSTISVN